MHQRDQIGTIEESSVAYCGDPFGDGHRSESGATAEGIGANYDDSLGDDDRFEGVTRIGDFAFHGCSGLISLTIPEGVTRIGKEAFKECASLVALILPASLEQPVEESESPDAVGPGAFSGCHRLSFVIAPLHLRDSFDDRFSDCPLLSALEADTEKNRWQALRLQYWSASTHRLCTRPKREWVVSVMLMASRLDAEDAELPRLPTEVWLAILGLVPRCALGSHPDWDTTC